MAAAAFIFAATTQAVRADTTTADFLQWEREAQISFLQIAMNMTGIIASQAKPEIARCLNEWYYADQDARNQEILDVMPQLAEHTPTTVVLAVVNDVCGEF